MEDLFVTRDQAKLLKDIKFDEPCIARFIGRQFSTNTLAIFYKHNSGEISTKFLSAPLKTQVFEWFENEHSLYVDIVTSTTPNEILDFTFKIKSWKFAPYTFDVFSSKAEGINAVIDELIRIVSEYSTTD